jgi:hypothetical protein
MKVLITGGGGFVGATLARTLLARGHLAGRSLATWCWRTRCTPPPTCRPTRACRSAPAPC